MEGLELLSQRLRAFVDAEKKQVSTDAFTLFMNSVTLMINRMVTSNDVHERLCGIQLIDDLIDGQGEEALVRFANYLQLVVLHPFPRNNPDMVVLNRAACAIGHLARASETILIVFIEFVMQDAFEWLADPHSRAHKKYTATILLTQFAVNAPTLFNQHLEPFMECIWKALRDDRIHIREAAAEALSAALALIAGRARQWSNKWFIKVFNDTHFDLFVPIEDAGLKPDLSLDAGVVHGSLLAYGKLLLHAREFMLPKFKDVCQVVLAFREHKEPFVNDAVVALLPTLAEFECSVFVDDYLELSMEYTVSSLTALILPSRKPVLAKSMRLRSRGTLFKAIGGIAAVVGEHMLPYLEDIMTLIRSGVKTVAPKPTLLNIEALNCLDMLARAVGPQLYPSMDKIIDEIFRANLSTALIEALKGLVMHIPQLLEMIQRRLLDAISKVLSSYKPISLGGMHSVHSSANMLLDTPAVPTVHVAPSETQEDSMVILALKTLGSFDLHNQYLSLLPVVESTVVKFLSHPNPEIRQEAVVTCCNLILPQGVDPADLFASSSYSTSKRRVVKRVYGAMIVKVVQKLITIGISDFDPQVRMIVLRCLDARFDRFLCQQAMVRGLLVVLNDEIVGIRELATDILGRIAVLNPAYVLPALRQHLIRLLTELKSCNDSARREQSSKLLGRLIRSAASSLISPYISPILKILLPQLALPDVSVYVLSTIGNLASVESSDGLKPYFHDLLPVIVESLEAETGDSARRKVALLTLGQLVQHTGIVVEPYISYPRLLPVLLKILAGQRETDQILVVRNETIKVLGIIGAFSPVRFAEMQLMDTTTPTEESTTHIYPLNNPEEHYPTAAINALMSILGNSGLREHHHLVIMAVMFIFKSLGTKCIPFLPQIVPPFVLALRNCDDTLSEPLFQQLAILVSIVKQHIRSYLPEIFLLVHEHWKDGALLTQILRLLEEISKSLPDEFKGYLVDLLPMFVGALQSDRTTTTLQLLHAFQAFGASLEDHAYLTIPPILRLCEKINISDSIRVVGIQTLGILCRDLDVSNQPASIIHPLVRLIRSPASDTGVIDSVIKTLAAILCQIQTDFIIFLPLINTSIQEVRNRGVDLDSIKKFATLADMLVTGEIIYGVDEYFELEELILYNEDKFMVQPESALIPPSSLATGNKILVGQQGLKKAWEVSQRSTREDWKEWMRRFSLELLKSSPSPALRACSSLGQKHGTLTKQLFNVAFLSCWNGLNDKLQDDFIASLETVFQSPTVPQNILQSLLELLEYMEHEGQPLPLNIPLLGDAAEKAHLFAQALYYREFEFRKLGGSSASTIESMISINNKFGHHDVANGILEYAQRYDYRLKESWYEKLQRWDDALVAYERMALSDPSNPETLLGRMRSLRGMSAWERLHSLAGTAWKDANPVHQTEIAPLGAVSAWRIGDWDQLNVYSEHISEDRGEGTFYRAICSIREDNLIASQSWIDKSRELLDREMVSLLGESFERGYGFAVKAMQLSEMEEIIMLKTGAISESSLKGIWSRRLDGCLEDVDVWQEILSVRSLVFRPRDDMNTWLRFASICRKNDQLALSWQVLTELLDGEEDSLPMQLPMVNVSYSYLKQLWNSNQNQKAFIGMLKLVAQLPGDTEDAKELLCRGYLKIGQWKMVLEGDTDYHGVLDAFHRATELNPRHYGAWENWALLNYDTASRFEDKNEQYVLAAVRGFFMSISLGGERTCLQDTLRLLNLWFKYGQGHAVEKELMEGFEWISDDTWLVVIPQIIARIHISAPQVRRQISTLLCRIGETHPQALVYPLTVASQSLSLTRKTSALVLLDEMRKHSEVLVEQASLIGAELIRIAVLWYEMWFSGIEEASRQYFVNKDFKSMMETLAPLHDMMENAETIREISFRQTMGQELSEALSWCHKYQRTWKESDIKQAWNLYCHVYRKIEEQLKQLTDLELQYISPRLLHVKDFILAVPGTYYANAPVVHIAGFASNLRVIDSKQRPRRLSITGSDGKDYNFLLKGHEDLRLDERVMQLFGLINSLLMNDGKTSMSDLSIKRYSVIPIAPNSGLIEWIGNSDTLHALIKEYRDAKRIMVTIEHELMQEMAPDYLMLPLVNKVEVFEYALDNTTGQDLYSVLWLKSNSSEVWLDRRTNYTRSLAVMSMVGYVLGLGDRHPCNLMLDRTTGKMIHIDFGDCFEVAMVRDKYPEKIPFRLTRMLVNAMEISRIEGNFKSTAIDVMGVLRQNKESVMAVLEAFVHDPLINWRLLKPGPEESTPPSGIGSAGDIPTLGDMPILGLGHERDLMTSIHSRPSRNSVQRRGSFVQDVPFETLNNQAVNVLARVKNKLTGRDFEDNSVLSVPNQVRRLITQATSYENLCQSYLGWCPFW